MADNLDRKRQLRMLGQGREATGSYVLELLSQGNIPWHGVWASGGRPVNGATLRPFNGSNLICLDAAARRQGYTDPRWYTETALEKEGARIREGEKSTPAELYVRFDPLMARKRGGVLERAGGEGYLVRPYEVYNAGQCENLAPHKAQEGVPVSLRDRLDFLMAAGRAREITGHFDRVLYDEKTHTITRPEKIPEVPDREFARSAVSAACGAFIATSEKYAKDRETGLLRRDMAASVIMADLGLGMGRAEREEELAQCYMRQMENDRGALPRLATEACDICDNLYMREIQLLVAKDRRPDRAAELVRLHSGMKPSPRFMDQVSQREMEWYIERGRRI